MGDNLGSYYRTRLLMTSLEIISSYSILVQDFLSDNQVCPTCGGAILDTDLAAKDVSSSSSHWSHLDCFQAMPFLRVDSEIVNHVFSRSNKERLKIWVERHNSAVEYHHLVMLESRYGRKLKKVCGVDFRFLQVLLWLSPEELAQTVSSVCYQWYSASWNHDLWTALWKTQTRYRLPYGNNALGLHPKLLYVLSYKACCAWCNRRPLLPEVAVFCPCSLQPICRECRGTGDFIVAVKELQARFQVTLPFLQKLHLDVFEYMKEKFTYFPVLVQTIMDYRVRRVEHVIKSLRENVPKGALKYCTELKGIVSNEFPILTPGESSKTIRYVLALDLEQLSSIKEVEQELMSRFVSNANADN